MPVPLAAQRTMKRPSVHVVRRPKQKKVALPWRTSSPRVPGTEALHFMYMPGMECSEPRAHRRWTIGPPLRKFFDDRCFHVSLWYLPVGALGLGTEPEDAQLSGSRIVADV